MTKKEADAVIALATDWLGSEVRAQQWFRTEAISAFGCRTPMQMVYLGDARQVIDYIEHLKTGGYA